MMARSCSLRADTEIRDLQCTAQGLLTLNFTAQRDGEVSVLLIGCSRNGEESDGDEQGDDEQGDLVNVISDISLVDQFARGQNWTIFNTLYDGRLQKDRITEALKSFFDSRLGGLLRILVLIGHGDELGAFLCYDGMKHSIITLEDIDKLRPEEDSPLFILADFCNSGENTRRVTEANAPTYLQASTCAAVALDGVFIPFFLAVQEWLLCKPRTPERLIPALRYYVKRNQQIPSCTTSSSLHERGTCGPTIDPLAELLPEFMLPSVAPAPAQGRIECPWRCDKSKGKHRGTHKIICGKPLDTTAKCKLCLEFTQDSVLLPCGQCMCRRDFFTYGFKLPDQSDSSS